MLLQWTLGKYLLWTYVWVPPGIFPEVGSLRKGTHTTLWDAPSILFLVSILLFIPIENICIIRPSTRFPTLIWNTSKVGVFSAGLSHLCESPVCTLYPFPAKLFPQWCADVCVSSRCWPIVSFPSVASRRSVFMGQVISLQLPSKLCV